MTGCTSIKEYIYDNFIEPIIIITLIISVIIMGIVLFFFLLDHFFGEKWKAAEKEERRKQWEKFSNEKKEERRKYDEEISKHDESIRSFIEKYKLPLTRKRKQLIIQDDYGDTDRSKWDKELLHFIETKIDPFLLLNPPHPIISSNLTKELYQKRIFDLLDSFTEENLETFNENHFFHEKMDGIAYEHFCANILQNCGWKVQVLQAVGDQGVDLLAVKNNRTIAIQCKRFSSNVGNSAVQEVVAGKTHYLASAAAVVSNSEFTASAKKLAASNNVLLLHHDDLAYLTFE